MFNKGILICGGEKDFNILRLIKYCVNHDIGIKTILTGKSGNPLLNYDFQNNLLYLEDQVLNVNSAFIRFDVFEYLETNSTQDYQIASSWYTTIEGWLQANPNVTTFNPNFSKTIGVNKLKTLMIAKQLGIKIPETYATNDMLMVNKILEEKALIHKPIEGGSHTEELEFRKPEEIQTAIAAYPFFVQEKLEQPEFRVFRIADQCFGFWVISEQLDYRADNNTKLKYDLVPEKLAKQVIELTDALSLNFSALDFKSCPKTGDLLLLEANSSPMFGAFDQACDGKLVKAMINYLTL
jgi:hypothetical protein